MTSIRKWSRTIHRDLSYFFAGVIIIYAVSGFVLNHKRDFNSDYSISQRKYTVEGTFPKSNDSFTKEYVLELLDEIGERGSYTKHYFPVEGQMKVFIKGGSSLVVDTQTGQALYESVKKRHVISAMSRLHYNPGRWWTVFSDVFVISLVVITITGLIMVRGPKGLWGRGGIELAAGIIIPLLFIFLS